MDAGPRGAGEGRIQYTRHSAPRLRASGEGGGGGVSRWEEGRGK